MKNKFKNLLILVLALVMSMAIFVGCGTTDGESTEETDNTVKIYSPDGAPALSLASAYDNVDINILTDSTALPATLSSAGDGDMAIVPSNMAVTMFNNFGAEFVATVTYGNLYMVGKNSTDHSKLDDYSSLVGKVVCSIGETNVPSQVFRAILDKENIEYEESDTAIAGKVAITYTSSLTGTAAILSNGGVDYVVSAEPSVSAVLASDDSFFIASDLQQEYADAFDTEYGFPQAVLVARDGYVAENPDKVYGVIEGLKSSETYLSASLSEGIDKLKDAGSIALLSVTFSAVQNSNLVCKTASEGSQAQAMYTFLSTFTSGITGDIPAVGDTEFYVDVPTGYSNQ